MLKDINANANMVISSTMNSLKNDGTVIVDGGMRRIKVDDKLLQHPSFLSSVEKLLRENLRLGSLYSTRPNVGVVDTKVGYDDSNGFYVMCSYGQDGGVLDRCYGNIKLDSNGYLIMEMSHVMEYDKSRGMVIDGKKDYSTSLYVKKEVFDDIGIERGDFSYRDSKDYKRNVVDHGAYNHFGRILFGDNGFYTEFPGENNKSISCQRFDNNQLLLPTFKSMTLNKDGTVKQISSSLCPISTEYIERLSHYNMPVAIQDMTTGKYKGYSDHLYDGMSQENVIASYNERYAAQILETTKTKEASPELYEEFVKKIHGTGQIR